MLWNVEHGRYGLFLCARLWSEQCWVPCSFSASEWLSVCRKFCGVHSWQNGTRCRNGVKVLWCHWFPSSLVAFLGFHPYTCLFSFRKHFLWLVSVLFFAFGFLDCHLEIVKKVGGDVHGSPLFHLMASISYCPSYPGCPMGQVGLSMGVHCPAWSPQYPTVCPIPPYQIAHWWVSHFPWSYYNTFILSVAAEFCFLKVIYMYIQHQSKTYFNSIIMVSLTYKYVNTPTICIYTHFLPLKCKIFHSLAYWNKAMVTPCWKEM